MAMTSIEKQKAYRERKAKGELAKCKQHPPLNVNERMRIYRKRHPMKVEEYKLKRQEQKRDVITYYGNGECACVKCGEKRLPCLSIDHIDGGRHKHFKDFGIKSSTFYKWLIDNNFPEGFQTLCMNCQWVKRFEKGEESKPRF